MNTTNRAALPLLLSAYTIGIEFGHICIRSDTGWLVWSCDEAKLREKDHTLEEMLRMATEHEQDKADNAETDE